MDGAARLGRRRWARAALVHSGGAARLGWRRWAWAAVVHSGGAGRGRRHALGPTTGADSGLGDHGARGRRRKKEEAGGLISKRFEDGRLFFFSKMRITLVLCINRCT